MPVTVLAFTQVQTPVGGVAGSTLLALALAPPWVLLYLVSGRRGLRTGWPLAVVGSLAYIAGQFPVSQFAGPYLPDIVGSLVAYFTWRDGLRGLLPFLVLVVVVVAWTGPWSDITSFAVFKDTVSSVSSITHKASKVDFTWNPFVAGTAILASWVLICLYLRPRPGQLARAFRDSLTQVWGALLVGLFIFGLAYVFNVSGMAGSMTFGFSQVGTPFIPLSPFLGWIAVALSGSNTASNAVFGQFQASVGKLLHAPVLCRGRSSSLPT